MKVTLVIIFNYLETQNVSRVHTRTLYTWAIFFCSVHLKGENFNTHSTPLKPLQSLGGWVQSEHTHRRSSRTQDEQRTRVKATELLHFSRERQRFNSPSASRHKLWTLRRFLDASLCFGAQVQREFYPLRRSGGVFPMMLGYHGSVSSTLWIQNVRICVGINQDAA